jgi:hypothetical protein
VIALIIRVDGPGPVLYTQERLGVGGRSFRLLKFRSMIVGADRHGASVSGVEDPRVTRVGRYLRRTKLDELPQLVNVLRGEMTLIGPRAEVARYAAHFTAAERELLCVRPGLTGPGQLWFSTHLSHSSMRRRAPSTGTSTASSTRRPPSTSRTCATARSRATWGSAGARCSWSPGRSRASTGIGAMATQAENARSGSSLKADPADADLA